MNLILGEIIRQKIRADGRTAKVICEELGMSRGNLDKIYHKESVNSDLLAKISLALGYDFFKHVNPFRKDEVENGAPAIWTDGVKEEYTYNSAHKKLRDAMQKLERLKQELAYLKTAVDDAKRSLNDKDEIIALMKDKMESQSRLIESLEAEAERLRGQLQD